MGREPRVWKDRPRHDEAPHDADAFLTFACSSVPDEDDMNRQVNWERLRREHPLRGIV
jgi:hypothetical protein